MGVRWSDGDRGRGAWKPGGGAERRGRPADRQGAWMALLVVVVVWLAMAAVIGLLLMAPWEGKDDDEFCWDALTEDDLVGDCPVSP